MNKHLLTGNVGNVNFKEQGPVGDKPGFSVLSFSVASNVKSASGKQYTNWVNCKLWGPRAKALHPHLKQGQAVGVEGRPEARAYLGTDGTPKAELTLTVAEFEFIGGKPDNAPDAVSGEDAVDGAEA